LQGSKIPGMCDHHFVLTSLVINKLDSLDAATQQVDIDFGIEFWYKDLDFVGKTGDDFDKTKVFKPEIEFDGTIDLEGTVGDDGSGSWWIEDEASPHGVLKWYNRYRGTIAAPMDLHEFPFDQQVVKLTVRSSCWGNDVCTFKNVTPPKVSESMSKKCNKLVEWDLMEPPSWIEETEYNVEDDGHWSTLSIELHYKRKSGFYMRNIVLLLMMIQVMGWSIFFVPSSSIDSRVSITITLFLATVAFNFVVVGVIPKISHGTHLATFFGLSYLTQMLETIQSVISGLIQASYGSDTSFVFDYASLIVFATITSSYTIFYAIFSRRKQAVRRTTVV